MSKTGTVRIYQAIQDDGSALWPEHRSLEWLMQQKATRPLPFFNAQFQNDPSGLAGVRYSLDDLQYYLPNELPPLRDMFAIIGGDPATSKEKTANYFGTCVVGRASTGTMYVLGFDYDNIEPTKHQPFLRAFYLKWITHGLNVYNVRLESHGPIQGATEHLAELNRKQDVPMPLELVKPKGSKDERFDELLPYYGNGMLLFPGVKDAAGNVTLFEGTPGFKEFKKEFTDYPIGGRDDLLDALWVAVDGLLTSMPGAGYSENVLGQPGNPALEQAHSMSAGDFLKKFFSWKDRLRGDRDEPHHESVFGGGGLDTAYFLTEDSLDEQDRRRQGGQDWEWEERAPIRRSTRFADAIPRMPRARVKRY